MGFWKFSAFLLLSILVLYQAGILQTAPFRSALESHPDRAILTEEETCLLLAALVKDYVQMKARELELEQETEGSSPLCLLFALVSMAFFVAVNVWNLRFEEREQDL